MNQVLGTSVPRVEDLRLIAGRGRFVGDLHLAGMLHVAFVRSPHAHARIVRVDASRAREGAALVLTAADVGGMPAIPPAVPHPAAASHTPPAFASDRVRYVGEPVAAVVAASRYLAEDLADLVEVAYEPLPVVTSAEHATEGEPLHRGGNVLATVAVRTGDAPSALRRAATVVRARFEIARASAQAIEPRAIVADPSGGRLTIWLTTQSPHGARRVLAAMLGLPEAQIRVIAPDVGGSFGGKGRFYSEYPVVAAAALRLGVPVAWIGDRYEDSITTYQERDQIHEWEIGLDRDARIVALRGTFLNDNGAYDSGFGMIPPLTTAVTIPGPYRVPDYEVTVRCVYTNKPPLAPVRGGGRQQGVYVMERLMDRAAQALGLDPADVRTRNLIRPDEMPYDTRIPRRDGGGSITYEGGDFPRALQMVLDHVDYPRLREEHDRMRLLGRRRGIGLACFVEMAGLRSHEEASVRVDPSGTVHVASASASQGQGHETAWAQVCAERLGVPLSSVRVTIGDTGAIEHGTGTFASRSAVAAGNAVSLAAQQVRDEALRLGAQLLEADLHDLMLDGGHVSVRGSPHRSVSLADLAQKHALEATASFDVPGATYGYGALLAEVEVDPELGTVSVLRLVMAHDCGREFNPAIVEGQVIGGAAHGLGNALLEDAAVDEHGQPLAATLLDYLLPSADTVPPVEVLRLETPDSGNPEGVKGVAEGGTLPTPAAIVNAVEDALGVRLDRIPVTPDAVRKALKEKPPITSNEP